jgi:hypothetical protein
MPQALQEWKVLPHGPLTELDENILTVTGNIHMPVGDFPRRMTVVRLADRRLVIYSAIALDEPEMQTIERFGRPTYLVVPGDLHRLDAKIWKERYPELIVVTPGGAREKVEKVVHVDMTHVDFGDPKVTYVELPGTAGREAVLVIDTPRGITVIVNDIIANMPERKGFGGWFLHLVGFTGTAPHVPRIVKTKIVDDKSALRSQFESWARLSSLKRVIVSHGAPIEANPQLALQRMASSLAS